MHHPSARRARTLLAAPLTALALLAAACTTADDEPAAIYGPADAGQPEAIVSLAPATTEILYAVGAGDQVVAVDERSNYPENAPVTDLSGYTPNLEAVLGYDPDLVVLTDDSGGIVDGLERAGVEVLLLPAAQTLDDTYSQIEQAGAATGHVGEAAELVAQMQTDIDQIVAQRPGWDQMTAVREGHGYVVDEDLASRWGPRIVDFMREVAAIVTAIPATSPAPQPAP